MRKLTKKEQVIMNYYWTYGPLFIRELQEKYREEIRHDEGRILLGEEGYYARTSAESGSKDRKTERRSER